MSIVAVDFYPAERCAEVVGPDDTLLRTIGGVRTEEELRVRLVKAYGDLGRDVVITPSVAGEI